jgi:hypothetical protein
LTFIYNIIVMEIYKIIVIIVFIIIIIGIVKQYYETFEVKPYVNKENPYCDSFNQSEHNKLIKSLDNPTIFNINI